MIDFNQCGLWRALKEAFIQAALLLGMMRIGEAEEGVMMGKEGEE